MSRRLRALLLRVLRVPAQPQPPAGDSGDVLMFRASHLYFWYRVTIWALRQVLALAALIGGTIFLYRVTSQSVFLAGFRGWWTLIEVWAWTVFVLQIPFSFALVRLDFEMRWYLMSDRSLRIREGTLVVREKTMTYANIQNISIRQNPLERLFGLSTVAVRAAGGGSGTTEQKGGSTGGHTHEARFDGVDNGRQIRDILVRRIRLQRDSGLGDLDDVTNESESPALDAARALLVEARALRAAL